MLLRVNTVNSDGTIGIALGLGKLGAEFLVDLFEMNNFVA